jgi:hypothetical protein
VWRATGATEVGTTPMRGASMRVTDANIGRQDGPARAGEGDRPA